MSVSKGIFTAAIGKKYVHQAKYLAYSCMLHAPHAARAVVTDRPEALSPYFDHVIPYDPGLGQPFALKTALDKLSPFDETLYADADSLLVNNVSPLWEYLDRRSMAYEGRTIRSGTWYFNVEKVLEKTGLPWIPQFNSGFFLFKRDDISARVFETASALMKSAEKNDDWGIGFFRGTMLPDEPFLALALAKENIPPLDHSEERGRFSRTLIGAKNIRINSVRGYAFFIKKGVRVNPLIVHFCGRKAAPYYLREKIRLFFCFCQPLYRLFSVLFGLLEKNKTGGNR
jgi:hypothetical protein